MPVTDAIERRYPVPVTRDRLSVDDDPRLRDRQIMRGCTVNHITAKICRDAKTWRSGHSNGRGALADEVLRKMFDWLEIGVKFIKTLAGRWDDRSGTNVPRKADNGSMAEGSASGADRIAVRLESQISIKTEDSPNNQQELRHCDLTSRADSIVVRPEGPISIKAEDSLTGQEIARRRKIVRHFFNDFWSSIDEKPGTFAERLNQAEDYINERLTACGETWLLDSATRSQLSLPPQSHADERSFLVISRAP